MLTTALFLPLLLQADETQRKQAPAPKTAWEILAEKYDANGDGKISREEYTKQDVDRYFPRLDADKNGFIEPADLKKLGRPKNYKGEKSKHTDKVPIAKAGEGAHDFTLRVLEKKPVKPQPEGDKKAKKPKTFQLASLRGKKPVALIFGSYT